MNNKVKLYGIILGIVLFAFVIIGFTYAWITWNSNNIAISGLAECLDIEYTAGQDIVNANVLLFDENKIINNNDITIKKGMAITNVIASVSSNCTIDDVVLSIGLDATSINNNYFNGDSVGAFKYAIARYDHTKYTDVSVDNLENISFEMIKHGSVIKSGESILIDNIVLSREEIGILIIFYIDGDLAGNNIQNSTFSGTIIGSAMQQGIPSLMSHIKNEYVNSHPELITHYRDDGTSDTYYYSYQDSSKTWGLMNDSLKVADTYGTGSTKITDTTKLMTGSEGNIRYFGPSDKVNNYVYFNCETYPSKNCERWRIIGIVDGKVKIIRDDNIGKLSWDQDKNQDSSLTTSSNNWETASLQLFLNGLYYNRGNTGTHIYYSGEDASTSTELNLVDIGIKNDITRGMVSKSTWYLGGYKNTEVYPNEIYSYERTNTVGTTIYNGNPYTITANVGLMSASDYGYGTDLTKCNSMLSLYNSATDSYACRTNNWLFNSLNQYSITPYSTNTNYSFSVYESGIISSGNVRGTLSVRPTLYINDSVLKVGGDGSYNNPYLIGTGTEQIKLINYLMEVTEAPTDNTSLFLRSNLQRGEISSVTFVDNNIVPEGYTGVDVSANSDRTVMMWYGAKNASDLYDVYIGAENGKVLLSSGAYLFQFLTNCSSINFNNILDTSNATSFLRMFDRCTSLTTLDVSSFDTSNVTDMSRMFYSNSTYGPMALTTINGISNFDTSKVTSMRTMFQYCSNLIELDLSGFDTSNVTDMAYMFSYCSSLASLNVSNFDTSNVTSMFSLFNKCSGLTSLDVSNFDTSSVTQMNYMFNECSSLTSLNVSNFDTSNVTTMYFMFNKCSSLTSLSLSGWDTSKVTSMRTMFQHCSNLIELDLSGFDTSNVTDMAYMFWGCSGLTNLNVSNFNTSSVTTMEYMFYNCSSLTSLDVSGFDTSSVTTMEAMFCNCSSLTELDVSKWNTSKVKNISYMFEDCSGLTELNISGWNISNLTHMNALFRRCVNLKKVDIENWNTGKVGWMYAVFSGCQSLESLDLSAWNVSNVTTMWSMFYNCYSLTDLDLSGWDTSKFTETREMFYNCNKLKTIYVSDKWNMGSVTNSTNMFTGCTSLVGGNGTTYNASYIDGTYARVDTAGTPGYLTKKSV